jgi:hypothetical protein
MVDEPRKLSKLRASLPRSPNGSADQTDEGVKLGRLQKEMRR